jgi:hypothetical protein
VIVAKVESASSRVPGTNRNASSDKAPNFRVFVCIEFLITFIFVRIIIATSPSLGIGSR